MLDSVDYRGDSGNRASVVSLRGGRPASEAHRAGYINGRALYLSTADIDANAETFGHWCDLSDAEVMEQQHRSSILKSRALKLAKQALRNCEHRAVSMAITDPAAI